VVVLSKCVGLRQPACWDCGLESHREHGCLSLVSIVCCQAEVSASDWSLVERSPTEFGVSECDYEFSTVRRPWPTAGCCGMIKSKRIPSIFKYESTGSCICLWKLAVAVATYVSICIVYRILPSFAF
jgi:hypothetical protein